MIAKKFEEIKVEDIQNLIGNKIVEGKTIEYKQELPNNADHGKKEFLADVSSFANTAGGDLIYGISESNGLPVGMDGVELSDADAEIRRLDSILQSGIEPRIQYNIRLLPLSGNKYLVIIRVRQSWIKPHRVIFSGHDKFYARGAAGKYALDVSELRNIFNLSETVATRIKNFRIQRLAEIESGAAPIAISGKNKIILHLIPLESFSTKLDIPADKLSELRQDANNFKPMYSSGRFSHQINYDGIMTYAGKEDRKSIRSYTQLFRSGIVEAVESSILDRGDDNILPSLVIERVISEYTIKYLNILKKLELNPPIFVFISLTNVKGTIMDNDGFRHELDAYPIAENSLYLPEATFENYDQPVLLTLKPSIDLIWNACGIPKSENISEDGNFIR